MSTEQILRDGNHVLILLSPTFSSALDENNYPIEVEYGDLPNEVQSEVLEFFKSEEFIENQAQNYALNDITANSDTYPVINTVINYIIFDLKDKVLMVHLYGTLIETYAYATHYQPVTSKNYEDNVKDGFWKASHSGSLTFDDGKYVIFLNHNRIKSFITDMY